MDRLNAGLLPAGDLAMADQIIGQPETDVVALDAFAAAPPRPGNEVSLAGVTTVPVCSETRTDGTLFLHEDHGTIAPPESRKLTNDGGAAALSPPLVPPLSPLHPGGLWKSGLFLIITPNRT